MYCRSDGNPPEIRISLIRVSLGPVSSNAYPKFIELETSGTYAYVAVRDPDALTWFPHGTILYEPEDVPLYYYNNFFFYKGAPFGKLFYDSAHDGTDRRVIYWGSTHIYMGDTSVDMSTPLWGASDTNMVFADTTDLLVSDGACL